VHNTSQGFNALAMPVVIKEIDGRKAFAFNGRQQFESDFGLPTTMTGNPVYSISAIVASPSPKENECVIDLNNSWGELEKIILGYGTSPQSGITMHHGWYEDMGVNDLPAGEKWNHLVVTFDGYKEKIYLNGVFIKEKDIFLNVGECKKMTLGSKFGEEHYFSGYLHSLKVYDIVLSEDDIIQ
ncbi:MAG: LamG domain-containing protein, partial [Tannerella sp.]|jgi:hypothetical protein|nr:LamG domain-containing protein [Tannerella sp.]